MRASTIVLALLCSLTACVDVVDPQPSEPELRLAPIVELAARMTPGHALAVASSTSSACKEGDTAQTEMQVEYEVLEPESEDAYRCTDSVRLDQRCEEGVYTAGGLTRFDTTCYRVEKFYHPPTLAEQTSELACHNEQGSCWVSHDPNSASTVASCDCSDGSGDVGGSGGSSDPLNELQLCALCLDALYDGCGGAGGECNFGAMQ